MNDVRTFEGAWADTAPIAGWLHETQARRLWELVSALTAPATVVEIGSYRGRSTAILGAAAPDGVEVVAVDPHAGNDRGPGQWSGTADEGEDDHRAFHANLTAVGVADRVRHVRRRSEHAFDAVTGDVNLLFVDGAHGVGPATADLRSWGARVAPGGTMLVHDAYLSVGVTLALLRTLAVSPAFRYLGRDRSLVRYRKEPVRGRARAANVLRQLTPLAWFARNQAVRAARLGRLRPVLRALGDDGGPLC